MRYYFNIDDYVRFNPDYNTINEYNQTVSNKLFQYDFYAVYKIIDVDNYSLPNAFILQNTHTGIIIYNYIGYNELLPA